MKHHIEFDLEFRIHKYPGKLIAIEGIDGSGKTTQVKRIAKELEKKGYKTFATKEPTDYPTGKFIRKVLSGELKVPPISLQYLYGADRAVHQEEIIGYLEKGYIVITDRYFWSSVAYGMSDMKKVDDWFLVSFSMLSFYNQFIVPDATALLIVDPEEGERRIAKEKKKREIYEHKEKLVKVEKGYNYLLKKFPEEFMAVDGSSEVNKVTSDLMLGLISRLSLKS